MTIQEYIAERRASAANLIKLGIEKTDFQKTFEESYVEAVHYMPRVLDMLERQQKALDYIAQFESHDKGLNKILLKAREAKEDLERMVNE